MQHPLNHDPIPMPWNKGMIMGQKSPMKRSEVSAIRVRLQIAGRTLDLHMFSLAIDSKLPACDVVRRRVRDFAQASQVAHRAIIMHRKTRQLVAEDQGHADLSTHQESARRAAQTEN